MFMRGRCDVFRPASLCGFRVSCLGGRLEGMGCALYVDRYVNSITNDVQMCRVSQIQSF